VFLSAVQSKISVAAYRSARDFRAWIEEQTAASLEGRDPSEAALVAFPELIGLPLLFHLERETGATKVQEAALELAREGWLGGLQIGIQHLHFSLSNLILPRAILMHGAILEAFSKAAKQHNAFIVGGSSFLPLVDDEAAKGVHIADARVQNVSYLFASSGRILQRSAKLNLTSGLESALGLSRAKLSEISPAQTPLGGVTTLICYDSFFESCVERADALGSGILVQPSANAAQWNGPWGANKTLVEGEEWLARGLPLRLQNRVNLRYGVNPMLVGKLFDLEFQGCSHISANVSLTGYEQPILRIAPHPDEFAVVSAQVN
jgi:predicted amidohydrolase